MQEIPVSFNSCLPSSVPKSVTVTNINGHVWKLKLRKLSGDPEKFSMVDGWKRIVKDEDLKGGEFLAFEFDGSRLFNFCVYGQATCKKLGKSAEVDDDDDDDDDVIVIDDDDDDDDDDEDDDGDDDEAADDEDDDEDVDVDVEADDVDDGMETEDGDEHRQLLDDPDSPSFTVILNPKKKSQLVMIIKDLLTLALVIYVCAFVFYYDGDVCFFRHACSSSHLTL